MIKKALRIGQLITDAHPSDVRLLFKAYNIQAEPTGKTIMDAYLVYGKPFLVELLNIGYKSVNPISSLDGTLQLEYDKLIASNEANTKKAEALATANAKDKAFSFDKLLGIFDSGATVLTTVGGAWNTISGIFTGKKVDTGTTNPDKALEKEYLDAKIAAQAAESANKTKTYLLIGAGVLVAVLVLIMYLKRKK